MGFALGPHRVRRGLQRRCRPLRDGGRRPFDGRGAQPDFRSPSLCFSSASASIFGIQFSVRYRQERFTHPDFYTALRAAAVRAGRPLALAAAATTCGFYSFLPTDYRGVSELGLIAGTA